MAPAKFTAGSVVRVYLKEQWQRGTVVSIFHKHGCVFQYAVLICELDKTIHVTPNRVIPYVESSSSSTAAPPEVQDSPETPTSPEKEGLELLYTSCEDQEEDDRTLIDTKQPSFSEDNENRTLVEPTTSTSAAENETQEEPEAGPSGVGTTKEFETSTPDEESGVKSFEFPDVEPIPAESQLRVCLENLGRFRDIEVKQNRDYTRDEIMKMIKEVTHPTAPTGQKRTTYRCYEPNCMRYDVRFRTNEEKDEHIQNAHGGDLVIFMCPGKCKKFYYSDASRRQHIALKHPEIKKKQKKKPPPLTVADSSG